MPKAKRARIEEAGSFLEDIRALGGDEEDLALLDDIGSEDEAFDEQISDVRGL